MSTTPRTVFPLVSTPAARPESRESGLDDTIESSFPASDAPSSIPDPEADMMYGDAEASGLVRSPAFWASVGALAISAVWLGLAWQRRRRYG